MYPVTSAQRRSPSAASARVTTGLKWAPETGPNMWMMTSRTPAVAAALASSTTPTSLLSRSAMMPEPTTPASRKAVPMNSATRARGCTGAHSRGVIS